MNINTKYLFSFMALLFLSTLSHAQDRPFITSFTPESASPGETVIITGYNLPTTNFKVTLGGVEAAITGTPTESAVNVIVPENSSVAVFRLTNLSDGLSAASSKKFLPTYEGGAFSSDKISTSSGFDGNQGRVYDVVTADFDNDGNIDIVSTSNSNNNLAVFRNTSTVGAISFSQSVLVNQANNFNLNAVTGDIDGDGLEDLITTEDGSSTNSFFIFENTSTAGNISFENNLSGSIPDIIIDDDTTARSIKRVVLEDFDGDGKKDILVNNERDGVLFLYENQSTPGTIAISNMPQVIEVTGLDVNLTSFFGLAGKDLNNDGLPEIIVCDNQSGGLVHIFQNLSIESQFIFEEIAPLTTASFPLNLDIGDIDGDGWNDIVVTDRISGRIAVHTNEFDENERISFRNPFSFDVAGTSPQPWGLDLGDINGDGSVDIIVAENIGSTFGVFINNSSDGNVVLEEHEITTSGDSRNIAVADIDGNGKPEVILAGKTTEGLIVHLNEHCQIPSLPNLPEEVTVLCGGSAQELSIDSIPGTSYAWQRSDILATPNFSNTGETSTSLTVNSEGIYRIIATSTGCSEVSDAISFTGSVGTIPPTPSIQPLPDNICSRDDITLSVTASAGTSYIWIQPDDTEFNGSTLEIDNISAEASGEYTVYAIDDASECRSSASSLSLSVTTIPAVVISTSAEDLFCEGETVSLRTQTYEAFDYSWLNEGTATGNTSRTTFEASVTGNYSLTISDSETGCNFTSNAISLRRLDRPVFEINAVDESCINVETAFASTISFQEPDLDLVYQWDFKDGNTSALESPSNIFTTAQTFSVSLEIGYETLSSCIGSTDSDIIISNIPSFSVEVQTLSGQATTATKCPDDSLLLLFPDGLNNYQWSTIDGGDTTVLSTDRLVEVRDANNYKISATNDINCTIRDSVDVRDLDNSGIDISYNGDIVSDGTITLEQQDIDVTLVASRGSDYQWKPAGLFDNPTSDESMVFPRRDTTILLSGFDTNGCFDSVSLAIVDQRILEEKALSLSGFNGDTCWEISNSNALANQGCTLYLFDNKGVNILNQTFQNLGDNGQDCIWDGTAQGAQVKPGIYYFVIQCPGGGSNDSGSIIVLQ